MTTELLMLKFLTLKITIYSIALLAGVLVPVFTSQWCHR